MPNGCFEQLVCTKIKSPIDIHVTPSNLISLATNFRSVFVSTATTWMVDNVLIATKNIVELLKKQAA